MGEQKDKFSESTQSLLRAFERLKDSKMLNHAYCITGPSKQSVNEVAEKISSILLSTKKIPHTDCIQIDCEAIRSNESPIDSIRQFIKDFQSTPLVAPYRVGLLANIQHLSSQSQNALLKTIEEPPAKGIFLCTTNHPQSLVPTILSRVALIRVHQPTTNEIKKLYSDHGITEELFSIHEYKDEIPPSRTEATEIQEKINRSITFFSNFCKNPSEHISILQKSFQEKEFDQVPIATVAHWWIISLFKEIKKTPSKTTRQRNTALIHALQFYLQSDLAINMPLWLQSTLAQYHS